MSLSRIFLDEFPFNTARPHGWAPRGNWPANWIALPASPPFVAAFKLEFELAESARLRFHVSADERYELFLDGQFVGRGSERGEPENWFFESYEGEIAPGAHVLVARVWALGSQTPMAQLSVRPGFLLASEVVEGAPEIELSTGRAPWSGKILGGFGWQSQLSAWGSGANQIVRGSDYDWGHERGEGDGWENVQIGPPATRVGSFGASGNLHRLRPAILPAMLDEKRRIGKVRHVAKFESRPVGITPVRQSDSLDFEAKNWQSLVVDGAPLEIPANTKRRVLIDLENYFCARSEIQVSGGRGAQIDIHWSEALYDNLENWTKGQRGEIEGKWFLPSGHTKADGVGDTFFPDGGQNRTFCPLWWQAGRFVQILVETGEQPLQIESLAWRETRYPLENEGHFSSDDARLETLIPLMVRGLQACAHETYMDCPFYEQLMYVGDTRLEVLTTYALTRDDRLPRKALQLFDWSRLQNGLTQSRFPSRERQIIPPFSLWWVAMAHDFALWRGDPAFVRTLLPGVRAVCDYFAGLIREDGLMGVPDGWNFTDWVQTTKEFLKYAGGDPRWNAGTPPQGEAQPSGILNWHAALVFRLASELEDWFGESEISALQGRRARTIADAADKWFWNPERGFYADDLAHENWSEHAQCLALLSGFVSPEKREILAQSLFQTPDLARSTIYFSHYLFEVCRELGRMDKFFERLSLWDDLAKNDLKTTIESPEPSRSDCHAWGAHPLFHFYASVAGIRPTAPGFSRVQVRPQPGHLQRFEARLPHPRGEIRVQFQNGKVKTDVPEGVALEA